MSKMNATAGYELTIVIPIYNEVDNLSMLEQKVGDYLTHAVRSACVLLVDDGSTDGSAEAIRALCERHPHFYFLRFARNAGLSAAIKAGIDATASRFVGYMDADMQTTPEDFNELLAYADEYTLVTGIRANRKDTFFKRLQSKIANGFRRSMTHDGATDTGCPLRILDREPYPFRVHIENAVDQPVVRLFAVRLLGQVVVDFVVVALAGLADRNLFQRESVQQFREVAGGDSLAARTFEKELHQAAREVVAEDVVAETT